MADEEQLAKEIARLQARVEVLQRAVDIQGRQQTLAEALCDTAAVLNSTLDLDEVLEHILANVGRVVPHDTANIMLVGKGIARIMGWRGYSERELEESVLAITFSVSETPSLNQMASTGQPLTISDTRLFPGWIIKRPNAPISYTGAPIFNKGRLIGFVNINIEGPEGKIFSEDDARRLMAFADQAAIALENARLYRAIRRQRNKLEERVAKRTAELDAYNRTIAHDLKAPIILIKGYAELVQMEYGDQLPEGALEYVDEIRASGAKMTDMIDQLLKLAQLRDAAEVAVPVEVGPVVEAVLERFKFQIETEDITIEVAPDLLPVMGHVPWIEEVFANLIGNAIKYKDEGPLRVSITSVAEGESVRYEVQDNGIGIDPEKQEQLFQMFTRLDIDKKRANGLGLGLSIVKRIVTKLNGTVGMKSAPDKGCIFWFTLPEVGAGS